jgi:cytosine/adenosine deaminase-related metal-dependent hydrolase
LHRLISSGSAPTGYELLKIATRGSAALLGRDDIGSLEPGKAADLFMIDASLLELAGAGSDPSSLLGTVGYSRPAKMVMVNGRIVSEDGRLTTIDEPRAREKAEKLSAELLVKARLM